MTDVPEYALAFVDDRVRTAVWGDLQLNVYTGTPTVADLDRLAAAQNELRASRSAGRIGIFSFCETEFEIPGAEVRRHGAKLQREMSGLVTASAVVVDGAGFWASAAISVINTIAILARSSSPARVFGEIQDAAAWMARVMPLDARALVEATNRLRTETRG